MPDVVDLQWWWVDLTTVGQCQSRHPAMCHTFLGSAPPGGLGVDVPPGVVKSWRWGPMPPEVLQCPLRVCQGGPQFYGGHWPQSWGYLGDDPEWRLRCPEDMDPWGPLPELLLEWWDPGGPSFWLVWSLSPGVEWSDHLRCPKLSLWGWRLRPVSANARGKACMTSAMPSAGPTKTVSSM